MNQRAAIARGLLLFCLLAVQAGCLSLRSVSATGGVGALIGPRAQTLIVVPVLCVAENTLAGATPTCPEKQVTEQIEDIKRYSQALTRYGTALRGLADFNDAYAGLAFWDLALGADLLMSTVSTNALLAQMSMARSAQTLGVLLSQEWRRQKLAELIRQSHPHILAVTDGLIARTALLTESTKYLSETGIRLERELLEEIDREPSRARPGTAAATNELAERKVRQAVRLSMIQFEYFARRGYEAISEYKKTLLAFRAAHVILYESIQRGRLGAKDRDEEIYELLKKELPPILK